MNNKFFTPSNAKIYGIQQVKENNVLRTKIETLDDVAQITFSSPVDTKPVLQIGNKQVLGYTYGQRLYAGTMQLPANSYPSFYNLFSEWIVNMNLKYTEQLTTSKFISVNAEDLPPFDIVILSMPETITSDMDYVNVFVYILKNVKIIETSVDLNTQSPNGQVMLYRFSATYIGQKIAVVENSSNIGLDADEINKITQMNTNTINQPKFTDLVLSKLYG